MRDVECLPNEIQNIASYTFDGHVYEYRQLPIAHCNIIITYNLHSL